MLFALRNQIPKSSLSYWCKLTYTIYSTTLHMQILPLVPFCTPPWVVQYILNDVLSNLRGVHKWVFHLYTPLMCTGNVDVSECYTESNLLS